MSQSEELFLRAQKVIPGGVNSPVRAFKSVGGVPRFVERGAGACFFDADNREYIDYVGSWGPLILGHGSAIVEEAVSSALERGTSFGAPTELEVLFAELLCEILPSVDLIRMVNSGTEATMSALRLARGFTKRDKVIKFNGCYHGHGDSFLVQAGSGVATCGISGSPGVPDVLAELTLSVPFNDLDILSETIKNVGSETIAAIIVEPVAGNMGLVLPKPDYLAGLRRLCDENGIVLIFDEVMTGFRVALGGAAERYGVQPDLLTYGKVIGGGLPVGAFGGRREIMEQLAPLGPVYQAGTLSGNPLAMAAGFAVVSHLKQENPYPAFEVLAKRWAEGMKSAADAASVPLVTCYCGTMLGMNFNAEPVTSFEEAAACNIEQFNRFFHLMLEEGVYLAPSAFEAGFLSTCHTESLIDRTIDAAERAFAKL